MCLLDANAFRERSSGNRSRSDGREDMLANIFVQVGDEHLGADSPQMNIDQG
jgi:hypothetical protein